MKYQAPTPDQFRSMLSVLELTGKAAGDVVGVSSRQIRRYTGGDAKIPFAVLYTLIHRETGIPLRPEDWHQDLGFATREQDNE